MTPIRFLLAAFMAASLLTETLAAQSNKGSPKNAVLLSPEDSTLQALQTESTAFFEFWNKLWKYSQTNAWRSADGSRYAAPFRQGQYRMLYQHCHAPGFDAPSERGLGLPGEYVPVRSPSAFSICPTWLQSDNTEYVKGLSANEADGVDATIAPQLLDSVRTARANLIRSLDRAQQQLPANAAISGQRVRFLLDQEMPDSALAVAHACSGDATFCLLVQGYVEARRNNLTQASALFDRATDRMSSSERCAWRDIGNLLPDSARSSYEFLSCPARQTLNAQYWWLADPLYSDSINDRRVEHDTRTVRMMLVDAFPRDERFFYWKKEYSQQALIKLVTRYGWPTYLAWGGPEVDRSHSAWLKNFEADTQPPYTTYEYSKGRLHTAPSVETLYSPFSVSDSSWNLNDPNEKDRAANWWPEEHMMRKRPLVTLPAYQIAMLRRETDVLLASAHDVSSPAFSSLRMNGVASLLVTPSPDTITRIETKPVSNATTVRMRGHIASARTLFAMEISDSVSQGIDARTRIGITPPITLRAMKPGEVALSQPIVLQTSLSDPAFSAPDEALLNSMMGSTTISLAANPRIGVFFESYGVRDRDTVSVSVSIRRVESVSALRRLRMTLNLADDPNGAVTITWKEPNAAHVTRTVGGAVPIQSRVLSLDISALSPGPYELVTGIRKGALADVTSSRRLTIVK